LLILNVGKTIALDPESGETVWETQDYGASYCTPTPFQWREEDHLAIFNGTGFVLLLQDLGEEVSRYPWTSQYNVNSASPIVVGERVFISTGYNEIGCAMLLLQEEDMGVSWQNKRMNSKMNGCILYDDHLFGFDKSILKCLDLEGQEKWRVRGLGMGTLIAAGRRLIVLSETGELVIAAADPTAFEELSRMAVFADGKCWTTPVFSAGRIYLRNGLGQLVCRDHRRAEATDAGVER
jgi:outer membrane protein assembly factor BamB